MSKPTDLVQGTVDLLILKTITPGPMHGWAIAQRIKDISNDVLKLNQNALYPALHRLEEQGAITSRWKTAATGRRRKYYAIKRQGRMALEEHKAQWRVVNAALASMWR